MLTPAAELGCGIEFTLLLQVVGGKFEDRYISYIAKMFHLDQCTHG